jgi:energy-coupling factor transport system ATP-binding protein
VIPHSLDAHWESGRVTVEGRDTRDTALADLARTVGVLFQDPETQLVMLETDDEIAFGLENLGVPRDRMRARVAAARDATGLGPQTPRLLERLSGGTKQRVALASLLAMGPRGIVLDEPTANLDPQGAREVLGAFAALCADRERSFLLVEHRLDLVLGLIDRVAVLGDDGRLALDADPTTVFMAEAATLERLGVWRPELAALAELVGTRELPRDVTAAAALVMDRWPRLAQPAPRPGHSGEMVVSARDLAYRYPHADRDAIGGASCDVRAGEIVALVGANGAGKSTLGLLLAGAVAPRRGSLAIAGRPLRGVDPSRVAYVFQYPERGFLAPTVREEVAYAARGGGRRDPDELLERFGLARLAEANPHSLSHGEKRRLSVASALVSDPDVLVLDEPTFGQDRRHARELVAILAEERAAGRATVLITHDLSLVAEIADRALALADGRIRFDGPPRTLFELPEVLAGCGLALPPVAEAFALARDRDPRITPITSLAEARAALALPILAGGGPPATPLSTPAAPARTSA